MGEQQTKSSATSRPPTNLPLTCITAPFSSLIQDTISDGLSQSKKTSKAEIAAQKKVDWLGSIKVKEMVCQNVGDIRRNYKQTPFSGPVHSMCDLAMNSAIGLVEASEEAYNTAQKDVNGMFTHYRTNQYQKVMAGPWGTHDYGKTIEVRARKILREAGESVVKRENGGSIWATGASSYSAETRDCGNIAVFTQGNLENVLEYAGSIER